MIYSLLTFLYRSKQCNIHSLFALLFHGFQKNAAGVAEFYHKLVDLLGQFSATNFHKQGMYQLLRQELCTLLLHKNEDDTSGVVRSAGFGDSSSTVVYAIPTLQFHALNIHQEEDILRDILQYPIRHPPTPPQLYLSSAYFNPTTEFLSHLSTWPGRYSFVIFSMGPTELYHIHLYTTPPTPQLIRRS